MTRRQFCAGLLPAASFVFMKGKAGKGIQQMVPGSDGMPGWTVDSENPATAGKVKIAKSKQDAEDLIDGSAEPFFANGLTARAMVWQNYARGKYRAEVYLWQMASASDAQKLWSSMMSHPLYATNVWKPIMVTGGEAARVTNSGMVWWVNARKGVYHVEVKVQPSQEEDMAGKAAALDFAAAVVRKL